jgi:nitroimidazol reductase NimA-like FMN-containing flavoprotein (pyridoxamine 5'-phosphate oxidase superfamily)
LESKPIPEEARAILDDRPTGHLATIRPDGRLSVNPVSVLFDGRHVQISTVKSRAKYENMLADPRIAISIPHRDLDPPDAERVIVTLIAEQISWRKVPLADAPPSAPTAIGLAEQ